MNEDNNEENNVIFFEDFSIPQHDIDADTVEVYVDKPWWIDLYDMHDKFDFHEAIGKMDSNTLRELLKFRLNFLQEELDEAKNADSAEDIVDALIDLCVVAIGTLDLFDIDAQESWNRVHNANMSKERGIKKERPNPLGLPDLIKPEGWTAPNHEGNHGILDQIDYTDFNNLF